MQVIESVTFWIKNLKERDELAAQKLWNRYFDRIASLAKWVLSDRVKALSDEEDVAISVFHILCAGAADGKFEKLSDRNDLWLILFAMTKRKAVDYLRRETRQKRGGGNVINESAMNSNQSNDIDFGILDELIGDDPTPDFLLSAEEEFQRLVNSLQDDELKKIAVWKMEGHMNKEIAKKLSVSEKTVERKLELIRKLWLRKR